MKHYSTAVRTLLSVLALCVTVGVSVAQDCSLVTGRIAFADGTRTTETLSGDREPDTLSVVLQYAAGEQSAVVLTDSSNLVVAVYPDTLTVDLEGVAAGPHTLWVINYTGNLLPVTGEPVYEARFSSECWLISNNPLRVTVLAAEIPACRVTTGRVAFATGETSVTRCAGPGVGELDLRTDYPVREQLGYALTDSGYTLITIAPDLAGLALGELPGGIYRLFAVTYTGALTGVPGDSVHATALSDSCYLLSANALDLTLEEVQAGSITTADGGSALTVCVGDGASDIRGFVYTGDPSLATTLVVTDTNNVILSLPGQSYLDFDGAGPGACRVWGLSYAGTLTAKPGDDAASAGLATGCFALSEGFVTVRRFSVSGGTLTTPAGEFVSLGELDSAEVAVSKATGSPATAQDYSYVLLDERLTVLEVKAPTSGGGVSFDITARPLGKYFVYGVSYAGTLAFAAGDAFYARGQSDGCYEVSTNAVVITRGTGGGVVVVDTTTTSPDDCDAAAGTLAPVDAEVTFTAPEARLLARGTSLPTVPRGYEVFYVLTSGEELTILGIFDQPDFGVEGPGTYHIHQLVAEVSDSQDEDFVDLSALDFGTSTAADFLAAAGERGACFALELPGARFTVRGEDTGVECTADAGALTPSPAAVALVDGSAQVTATTATRPELPAGFEVNYVLTRGADLVILSVSSRATFTVDAAGTYRIHTLVGEFDDPQSSEYLGDIPIEFGLTTAAELQAAIDAGERCASLDPSGAVFTVSEASDPVDDCEAVASTLTAVTPDVTLANGSAALTARIATRGNVPGGYTEAYLLSSGDELVIEGLEIAPSFTVTAPGTYRIHAVVVDLADTAALLVLGASSLILGETTAAEALALAEEAGICFDLDEQGARFTVRGTLGLGAGATAGEVLSGDAATVESVGAVGNVALAAHPSAAGAEVDVTLTAEEAALGERAVVTVTDLNGQVVAVRTVAALDGVNSLSIPLGAARVATYVVSVQTTQGMRSIKVTTR